MQKIISEALQTLKEGKIILYPSDTVWGIGCDASNEKAVEKIYQLKQRADSKALICLVADDRMLSRYVEKIPQGALDIIQVADSPTTIVYDQPKNVAKNLVAEDNTLAIRIPDDEFCYQLMRRFNGAIVSTSANISGFPTPSSFQEISEEILKGVDYVVNLQSEKKNAKPSSIIKISNNGIVKIIRK